MAGSGGGSRYLKEPFDYAHEMRVEATERIMAMQFQTVERRLERIEEMVGSVERRLWLMVFGAVGIILTEAVRSFLEYVPR